MLPFSQFLSFITTDSVDETHSTAAFRIMLAIASIWTATFLFLTGTVAYAFIMDAPQNVLVLRAVRSIASLSTTILFLPFTSVLFRGLACPDREDGWFGVGWSCDSAPRIVVAIILVLLLVGFSGLSLFIASVFVDRSPTSPSWSARVSGRVDVLMLVSKLILGFIYNVIPDLLLGTWVLTAILIASGVVWFYLYFSRMPLVHPAMNVIQAGFALGYMWTAIALGLQQLFGGDAPDRVYVVTPIVIALGAALTHMLYRHIGNKSLQECGSLYEVDIWCRHCLRKYMELGLRMGEGTNQASHGIAADDAEDAESMANWDDAGLSPPLGDGPEDTSDDEEDDDEEDKNANESSRLLSPEDPRNPSRGSKKGVGGAGRGSSPTRGGRGGAGGPPKDAMEPLSEKEQFDRERNELLVKAEEGYRYMMHHFGNHEMAYLSAAVFFRDHWPFQYNEALALARAKRKAPAADIRFYIYQRSRQLRESDKAGMSPLDRVLYDQYWKETVEMRTEAARQMAHLWEALAERQPDMARLQAVGVQLQEAVSKINFRFQQLLELNSDSTATLRAYATHLIEFANESGRAQELLNKADRLDDRHSKDQSQNMRHVVFGALTRGGTSTADLMDDTNALITISGDPSNLGEILFVSPAACRTFGYASSQMIGQSISSIVPQPIRAYHDHFLRRFGKKRASPIVGHNRVVFGVTRVGTLIPIWIGVMEAPPDEETLAPRFTAVIKPIQTDENHVIFLGPERGFRVMGASDRSLDMVGLEPENLEAGHISLLHWFPSAAPSFKSQREALHSSQISQLAAMPSMMDMAKHLQRSESAAAASDQKKKPNQEGSALGGLSARQLAKASSHRMNLESSFRDLIEAAAGHGTTDEKSSRIRGGAGRGDGAPLGDDPLSHAIEGLSGVDADTGEPKGSPTAKVRPLLKLRKTGLIPVQRTADGTKMLVGSVQHVSVPGLPSFYLLRWHSLDAEYGGFFNEQGLRAPQMHSVMEQEDGGVESDVDSAEAIESDAGSTSTAGRPRGGNGGTAAGVGVKGGGAGRGALLHSGRHVNHRLGRELQDTTIRENADGDGQHVFVPGFDTQGRADTVGPCEDAEVVDGLGPAAQVPVGAPVGATFGEQEASSGDYLADASRSRTLQATDGLAVSADTKEQVAPLTINRRRGSRYTPSARGDEDVMTRELTNDTAELPGTVPSVGRGGSGDRDRSTTWADGERATSRDNMRTIATDPAAAAGGNGPVDRVRSALRKEKGVSRDISTGWTPVPGGSSSPGMGPAAPRSRRMSGVLQPQVGVGAGKSGRVSVGKSRKGGAAGSVGSGGSQSTQLTRQLAMLTRFRDPEVGRVRGVMVFLVGMMLVMAGVATFWMDLTTDRLQNLTRGLWLSGFRINSLHDAAMWLNAVESANAGLPFLDSAEEMGASVERLLPDMLDAEGEIFELGRRGGSRGFEFETTEEIRFMQLSDDGTRSIVNRSLPVTSAADVFTSLIARMARGETSQIVSSSPDFVQLVQNFDEYQAALNQSSVLRQFDLVTTFPRVERELLIGGSVGFFITVVVSTVLFVSVARRLGSKTARVLQVFMMIPRTVAKSLYERANARLQRVIVSEQMTFMGDTGDGGAEQRDAEDEEDRLIVEEEEADAKLQKVLRRHVRAQQSSRMRAGGNPGESMVWLRSWVDSSHYVLKTSAKLVLPALLVFLWLGVMVLVQYLNNEDARQLSFRMSATQEVEAHTSLWGYQLVTFMSRSDRDRRLRMLDAIEERGSLLRRDLQFLRLGGVREFPELDRRARLAPLENDGSEVFSLLLLDACPASPMPDACREIENGVLRDGAASGIFSATSFIQRITGGVLSNDTVRNSPEPLLLDGRLRDAFEAFWVLYSPHLNAALSRMSTVLRDDIQDLLDNTGNTLRVFNWTFVAAFVVGMLFAYNPVTTSVLSPLRSARDLLRMMPMELVDSMPELREEMQDVVAHAEDGTLERRKKNVRQKEQGAKGAKGSWWKCCWRGRGDKVAAGGNDGDSEAQSQPQNLVTRDLSVPYAKGHRDRGGGWEEGRESTLDALEQ